MTTGPTTHSVHFSRPSHFLDLRYKDLRRPLQSLLKTLPHDPYPITFPALCTSNKISESNTFLMHVSQHQPKRTEEHSRRHDQNPSLSLTMKEKGSNFSTSSKHISPLPMEFRGLLSHSDDDSQKSYSHPTTQKEKDVHRFSIARAPSFSRGYISLDTIALDSSSAKRWSSTASRLAFDTAEEETEDIHQFLNQPIQNEPSENISWFVRNNSNICDCHQSGEMQMVFYDTVEASVNTIH